MPEATVTRTGTRISRIRFKVTEEPPLVEYHRILKQLPNDRARREWVARPVVIEVVDGWAEVRER